MRRWARSVAMTTVAVGMIGCGTIANTIGAKELGRQMRDSLTNLANAVETFWLTYNSIIWGLVGATVVLGLTVGLIPRPGLPCGVGPWLARGSCPRADATRRIYASCQRLHL